MQPNSITKFKGLNWPVKPGDIYDLDHIEVEWSVSKNSIFISNNRLANPFAIEASSIWIKAAWAAFIFELSSFDCISEIVASNKKPTLFWDKTSYEEIICCPLYATLNCHGQTIGVGSDYKLTMWHSCDHGDFSLHYSNAPSLEWLTLLYKQKTNLRRHSP